MLPEVGRFGDLRRRILSFWRSVWILISNEVRDRNNPISPHQFRLQSSNDSFTRLEALRQSV